MVEKMKITIELTKTEFGHLSSPHTFFVDECEETSSVMYKVQKQIDKIKKQRGLKVYCSVGLRK